MQQLSRILYHNLLWFIVKRNFDRNQNFSSYDSTTLNVEISIILLHSKKMLIYSKETDGCYSNA